jgi:hypothetical protein
LKRFLFWLTEKLWPVFVPVPLGLGYLLDYDVHQMRGLAEQFRLLREAFEAQSSALEALGHTLQEARRDHPDWFDPDTGYLRGDA